MRTSILAWAAISIGLASCFSVNPSDGAVKCLPGSRPCPQGYFCGDNGYCYQNGHLAPKSPEMAATPSDMSSANANNDMPAPHADTDMSHSSLVDMTLPCTQTCADSQTLNTCDSKGTPKTVTCAYGCTSTPSAHCAALVPSTPVTATDINQSGLASVTLASGNTYILNTDDGSISNVRAANTQPSQILSGIYFRSTATVDSNHPGAGIYVFGKLTLEYGATVQIVGSRAASLVATDSITIAGLLDGRAYDTTSSKVCYIAGAPGPGGFAGGPNNFSCANCDGYGPGGGKHAPAGNASGNGGGAGGGHGDIGGAGGNGATASGTSGGTAGAADYPSPLWPIHGGSGGGSGRGASTGGGGGGAIQLVAANSVTLGPPSGTAGVGGINAGGCGGMGGNGMGGSGAGGGAGGMILIEAPSFMMTAGGRLAANGGGGGSYNNSGTLAGVAGSNATLDDMAAFGAAGTGQYAMGGNGGAAGRAFGDAGYPATGAGQSTGGAGGGAAGIIVIRNLAGSFAPPAGAIISPTINSKNGNNQIVSGAQAATIQ